MVARVTGRVAVVTGGSGGIGLACGRLLADNGYDLLVHAAGVLDGTFVRKERADTFDYVLRTNLRSTFVVSSTVLSKMPVGGRIVFISSSAAHKGMKGRSAYSASKAGMNAFAEALADEVARDGIHVNVVTPAPVRTEMLQRVTFPMRTLDAGDVASAVLFLDRLQPGVVVPEIAMHAVEEGPLAPEPVLPAAYLEKA